MFPARGNDPSDLLRMMRANYPAATALLPHHGVRKSSRVDSDVCLNDGMRQPLGPGNEQACEHSATQMWHVGTRCLSYWGCFQSNGFGGVKLVASSE